MKETGIHPAYFWLGALLFACIAAAYWRGDLMPRSGEPVGPLWTSVWAVICTAASAALVFLAIKESIRRKSQ